MKKYLFVGLLLISCIFPNNVNALEENENQEYCECVYDDYGYLEQKCELHMEYDINSCSLFCPQGGCY